MKKLVLNMMAYPFSQYPAQIDNSTSLPPVVDLVSPVRGAVVNSLRNAIINVQGALGVNPNSVYGTVGERISVLEAAVGGGGSFTAGGDLSGTGTNQTVIGLQTRPVSNSQPSVGQGLVWNGSEWSPGSQSLTGAAGGDLLGDYPNPSVAKLHGVSISLTPPTTNQVLQYNGSDWAPASLASNFIAGGDLSGTSSDQTVIGIRGISVSATAPSSGQVLEYNGSSWAPTNLPSSLPPSGSAGGNLSGTYPNPNVISINGASVPAGGSLTIGNGLYVSGSAALSYSSLNLAGGSNYVSGILPAANLPSASVSAAGIIELTNDLGGTSTSPSVLSIHGATIPAAGSLTTGNGLYVSGSSALSYSSLNLAGGSAYVSGVLPSANQANQTMGGDVSGTTNSSTVTKLQGNAVSSGSISEGQFLVASAVNTWSAETISGDITSSVSSPGKLTVSSIAGSGGVIPFNAVIEGTTGSSFPVSYAISNVSMSSDANLTLSASQLICPILRVTSSVSLTATRSIILPSQSGAKYDVFNGTTGGQSLLFIASTGAGITVPNGLKTSIYFDGTNYVTAAIVIGGDLSATSNVAQTVIKIQGNAISNIAPTDGYVLTWSALNNQWMPEAITSGSVTLNGDVTGAASSNIVSGIKGVPILAAPSTIGQILVYNGTDWVASLAAQIKSSTYTIATTDGDIFANLVSNGWTLTLPPSPFTGEKHTIKDFDGYAGHATINGSAASLTFSSPTMTLTGGSGFTSAMTGLNITISNSFLTGTTATLAFSTPTVTLTQSGAGFTSAMTGLPITITNSGTAANDGTFILTYISATSVSWSNSSGAVDNTGTVHWSVNETVNDGTFPLTYISSTSVSWTNASGIANSSGAIVWSVPNNLIISGNGNSIEQWGGTGTASTLLLSQNYDSATLAFSGTGGVGTWNIM